LPREAHDPAGAGGREHPTRSGGAAQALRDQRLAALRRHLAEGEAQGALRRGLRELGARDRREAPAKEVARTRSADPRALPRSGLQTCRAKDKVLSTITSGSIGEPI